MDISISDIIVELGTPFQGPSLKEEHNSKSEEDLQQSKEFSLNTENRSSIYD